MRVLARLGLVVAVLALPLLTSPPVSASEADSPGVFVGALGGQAIAAMADTNLGAARLDTLIRQDFDLDGIGLFVLGSAGGAATTEQLADFQSLFATWIIDSYVYLLPTHDVSFTVTGSEPINGSETDTRVHSVIARRGRPPINADWVVRTGNGQSKIVDVAIEGVSIARTKREEFTAAIRRDGMAGMLGKLRVLVASLDATAATRNGARAVATTAP